jgi:hypothetical protein
MAKRETNVHDAEREEERRTRLLLDEIPTLNARASKTIEELAKQIRRCCSSKKWTSGQKREACLQLVKLAGLSTQKVFHLAIEFPEPFREIAEQCSAFPSFFPAHVDHLRLVQRFLLDELNLGKRHYLKLRAVPRRKTFSTETWVNHLLLSYIYDHDLVGVPLTRENAKRWLDAMWELLLLLVPNPESHPRLRQLGGRPSLRRKRIRRDGTVGEKTQAHNIRAAIKAKLGVYLKRILNDSAAHK